MLLAGLLGELAISRESWAKVAMQSPKVAPSVVPSPAAPEIPALSTLLRPALWKRLVEDKEIMVHASLDDLPEGEQKKYSFYAAMLVSNNMTQAREVLTDYKLYSKMIPYVDRAEYSSEDHILEIEGGIWNFKLKSEVLFDESSDRWIHYRIVSGSFSGLEGDVYFESQGEKGTVVYFNGQQLGSRWPPRFVIERGAEIVFGFTANHMRSYIESRKKLQKGEGNGQQGKQGQQIPQPRAHL